MKYISSTPEILSGMPVITGTRVPIARILFLLKEGYLLEEIHHQFENKLSRLARRNHRRDGALRPGTGAARHCCYWPIALRRQPMDRSNTKLRLAPADLLRRSFRGTSG